MNVIYCKSKDILLAEKDFLICGNCHVKHGICQTQLLSDPEYLKEYNIKLRKIKLERITNDKI